MNELLKPSLRKFVVVFFYDILVYNSSLPQHVHQLEEVLSVLTKGSFFLRQSKCLLACQTLLYLGHIVSDTRVAPDPSKISAMVELSLPCFTWFSGPHWILQTLYPKLRFNRDPHHQPPSEGSIPMAPWISRSFWPTSMLWPTLLFCFHLFTIHHWNWHFMLCNEHDFKPTPPPNLLLQ